MLNCNVVFKITHFSHYNKNVFTIANPEKIAPATKYGGKYCCMPSWNNRSSKIHRYNRMYRKHKGVANPARTKETSSKRCQSFALPVQPKLNKEYIFFWKWLTALSLIIAKSGINLSTKILMKPISMLKLQIHPK